VCSIFHFLSELSHFVRLEHVISEVSYASVLSHRNYGGILHCDLKNINDESRLVLVYHVNN